MAVRSPYAQIRGKTLRIAWRTIRASGARSRSADTQREIQRFDAEAEARLARIDRQLRQGKFSFAPQHGLRLKKGKGKGSRPVVRAPVENRIVQRAMLDVLQKHDNMGDLLVHEGSFGGIPGHDVRDALDHAIRAIRDGRRFYVRSDIKGFFTKIPRAAVVTEVDQRVRDPDFAALLEAATTTTLANLAQLGPDAGEFPLSEEGVAQGSPLSALLANVSLYEFDRRLNGRGITCIRYLDDFLILAESQRKANRAFLSAQRILGIMGMEAYDPTASPDKAARGDANVGLDFLGCTIQGTSVMPSCKACGRLIDKLRESLSQGAREMRVALTREGPRGRHKRFVQVLAHVDSVVSGWGDAYSFCPRGAVFARLDERISKMLDRFVSRWRQLSSGASQSARRRLLGVHLLADTPYRALGAPRTKSTVSHETR